MGLPIAGYLFSLALGGLYHSAVKPYLETQSNTFISIILSLPFIIANIIGFLSIVAGPFLFIAGLVLLAIRVVKKYS